MKKLAMLLISYLERNNYVEFEGMWRTGFSHMEVLTVFREANLALYHQKLNIWVPDVGTYDWMVRQKFGAKP